MLITSFTDIARDFACNRPSNTTVDYCANSINDATTIMVSNSCMVRITWMYIFGYLLQANCVLTNNQCNTRCSTVCLPCGYV